MLWFYFTGTAILVGGEINSEIENEMARQGAPDAKEKGEKAPGQKERDGAARPVEERRTASTSKSLEERPRVRAAHGRVTRVDHDEEGFSLGKVAVDAAAWALAKVGIRTTDKRIR